MPPRWYPTPAAQSVYHEGELAVQARAGVAAEAKRIANGIRPSIPLVAREFLRAQPMVVVASSEPNGPVWASLLTGPPGFVQAPDEHTVRVEAWPAAGDPLSSTLRGGAGLGLLAIDFATRRRMRLNGTAALEPPLSPACRESAQVFSIHARQVYANCSKYVQAREWMTIPAPGCVAGESSRPPGAAERVYHRAWLSPDQRRWIERADTFYIASAHSAGGADASHRGGNPGFVRVPNDQTLVIPDYPGNTMFNTLGNLHANPRAGLLFVDFDGGATLQLTGTARIIWDRARAAELFGADRVLEFLVAAAVHINDAHPLRSRLTSYSPFNPA